MLKKITTMLIVLPAVFMFTGCAQNAGSPIVSDPPQSNAPSDDETPPEAQGLLRPLFEIEDPFLLAFCPEMDAVAYDGDLDPANVEMFLCKARESDTGTVVEGFAVEDVTERTALLDAYAVRSDRIDPAVSCIELAADPLIVWVKDRTTEEITAYHAPVDVCGFPKEEATEVYNSLTLSPLMQR